MAILQPSLRQGDRVPVRFPVREACRHLLDGSRVGEARAGCARFVSRLCRCSPDQNWVHPCTPYFGRPVRPSKSPCQDFEKRNRSRFGEELRVRDCKGILARGDVACITDRTVEGDRMGSTVALGSVYSSRSMAVDGGQGGQGQTGAARQKWI